MLPLLAQAKRAMYADSRNCRTFSMAVSSSTASWCRCAALSLPRMPPSCVSFSDEEERGLLPATDCATPTACLLSAKRTVYGPWQPAQQDAGYLEEQMGH